MFLIAAEKAITRRWLQRVSRTMEDWRGIISESYRGRNHSLLHKKTKGSEFMEEMGGFCGCRRIEVQDLSKLYSVAK